MRFKTSLAKEPKHTDFVTCVDWNTTEEVYSCSDDHTLLRWNLMNGETVKITDLPNNLYPTDMHWFPRGPGSNRKQGSDLLVITSADGKFHLLNRNGRVDRTVDAHKGAVLVGRWSYDGAGLLTAGEDGQVKIWSRGGMLRSTVVQAGAPVYSAAWSADSNQVLYAQGKMLVVKPLMPNSNPIRWKAHEALILKVAWNPSNNLIVSGGEDCRYKVWDPFGQQLYCSGLHEYPITALSWAPNGGLFAVGSFNTLRLCDESGWSHSLEKLSTGSVYALAWSSDGTQIAGACANGHCVFAHVIERRLEWHQYEATLTGRRNISVRDVSNESWERLEFPDRVIQLALGYDHLVVVTPSQCHIFDSHHWNTPSILELREGSVCMLLLCPKFFLLVERASVNLYSYEGRLVSSPRWAAMQPETMNDKSISLSDDTIAARDQNDAKVIHIFEIGSTKALSEAPPMLHTLGILEIALNQGGSAADRLIAFVDRSHDLFLASVHGTGQRKFGKLGKMVQSLRWNCSINILAAIQDTTLTVWYYPAVIFSDKRIVEKTCVRNDSSDFGKNPIVASFVGNHVGVRRVDGSLVNSSVPMTVNILHEFASSSRWEEARKLCRVVKEDALWACLAAMAIKAKNLLIAEEAYAAIEEMDRVEYIQHIKKIPNRTAQMAEMILMTGSIEEAENLLLQNGLIFRAIMANVNLHNWIRALDLATKHRTHVDTVLYNRNQYLEAIQKSETSEKFLALKDQIKLDPDKIQREIDRDLEREKGSAK
ncbi:hypothetical protein ONE63_004452 [Megalurothrips usitatus]|uniref:Intraflagellar transport protein 80 homolog n=1 Tax=Megalurothrips usitatus TaxID=439358 RepID=A0AAV7X9R7_9NEOP|nr:hypothetical protein ONE63_004452 [Megalurothrips usitatus]